jgi:hypothetical protein
VGSNSILHACCACSMLQGCWLRRSLPSQASSYLIVLLLQRGNCRSLLQPSGCSGALVTT